MNRAVTDVITSYKPRNIRALRDQQIALTPHLDPNMIECQVTEYLYNAHRTLVDQLHEACFRCHYLPLKSMEPRKYIDYSVVNSNIAYLVDEEVITPFLVFINKKMVPWSMIRIIMSHEVYHIVCRSEAQEWIDRFQNVESVDIIQLCDGCTYVDFPTGVTDNRIFGFDTDGNFTDSVDCPISIMDDSYYMHFANFTSSTGVNAYAVTNDTTIKYYPDNVILFRNGLLDTESKINFESTLLSIADGKNENGDKLDFSVFRDVRTRETLDNIKHASLTYIKPFVEKQNAGEEVPEYMEKLEEQFDFEMSRKKDYSTNVTESIEKIINYNASLFEEAYLKDRNLIVEEYDGAWALGNLDDQNQLKIPRRHGLFTEEYILMLVNGILYQFYYMAKYTPDYYIIPIQGINEDDRIDIFRFQGVNNNRFEIRVGKDDAYIKYDENYINTDMVLFSAIPPTNDYEFPADGLQHFPVPYHLDYNDDGLVKIVLEDDRYYDQPLKVAYKHQFRHYWFDIVQSQATDSYCVDLGTKFMYCNDYSKYMVFFNGRRLSTDQYRLCLPVRSGTPFSKFELYLTMLVKKGDRVDVIYTPSLLKDVVLQTEIGEDGKITVDKSNITYSLTKNLYMVWVNGRKIPASWIANIDSTHIKIIHDVGSTKTVCVTKFLPDIDELTEVFKNNTALWDQIMASLTDEEIEQILSFTGGTITNTDPSIYDNTVPVRSVMLELIREKFIMAANVDTTGPFAYDYVDVDTTAIEGKDSGGNSLLMAGDSNRTDNIDGVKRQWP
uniref:Uncharacterized protein n=1 Tax=Myoviridae sp. ctwwN25 TaxID=2825209 RepID=A0A8S5PPZ6_9CAUD|nr:MAG TPA: hypothetical protein [Myoviridae sp. ctwwN25]